MITFEYGPLLETPSTKPLGEGLFEIRARGKEGIGRSFFCTVKGKEVIVLHSFIKKSQKTPKNELKIAGNRLKEVKS
jgi:phage-related protein